MLKCILLLVSVYANYILIPKENIMYELLDGFNEEHFIENLATIDNLKLYTMNSDNYDKYKNTVNMLYDIEHEQMYSIDYIEKEEDVIFVKETDSNEFHILDKVSWHLDRIDQRELPLDNSFRYNKKGSCHTNSEVEIETVVVDTGCDIEHEEFEGRAEFLMNFTEDNLDYDGNSHGTHCAGLIGSKTYGVCKDAKIFCVKVLDSSGRGSTSGVIKGMDYAFQRHLLRSKSNKKLRTIMSMSLGGGKSMAMNRVVENMVRKSDTFYVTVASGNEDSDACNTSPASAKGIFSVMASNKYDDRAYFSNYGRCADIYSPGVDIKSTIPNNKLAVYSGTSMATPILAGVLNHYIDMYPEMNMSKIKKKMMEDGNKNVIKSDEKDTNNLLVYLNRN